MMLLYLPLAHNFGRLMHLVGARVGFTIALLADPLHGRALPQVRPTSLPSVPRVYEEGVRRRPRPVRRGDRRPAELIDWALRVGCNSSPYRQRGERLPRALAAQFRLADRLVYSKVKDRLGGRLRGAISGGAPLAPEIGEFFHAIDITILEGYGLTVHDGVLREPPRPRALRDGRPRAASLRAAGRRGRRDPDPERDDLRRVPEGRGSHTPGTRRRRLAPLRRHRHDRRGRLPADHQPQEGHPHHRRRQERRAPEPRERADRIPSSRRRWWSATAVPTSPR